MTEAREDIWNGLCVELRAEVQLVMSFCVEQQLDDWRDDLLIPLSWGVSHISLDLEEA
jgi:hypothetical protein